MTIRQNVKLDAAGEGIYPTEGFYNKKLDGLLELNISLEEAGYHGEVLELCTIPQYEADVISQGQFNGLSRVGRV
jgi:hypothetical protein